jgi:hypothetical protein
LFANVKILEIIYLIGTFSLRDSKSQSLLLNSHLTVFPRTDPNQDYGYYDLTKDADYVLAGGIKRAKNSFDRVNYWMPKQAMKSEQSKKRHSLLKRQSTHNIFNSELAAGDTFAATDILISGKKGSVMIDDLYTEDSSKEDSNKEDSDASAKNLETNRNSEINFDFKG